MNCQIGNVALVVKGREGNIGKIVLVYSRYGDVDYSSMGYGILPCWNVESLGGDLDREGGPALRGYIPDLALQVLPGINEQQATAMRYAKAQADTEAAIADLGKMLRTRPGLAECEKTNQAEETRTPQSQR